MDKNLRIAIIFLSIAIILSIYGICYSAGQPVAKLTFTHIEGDQIWQLHFTTESAPIGLVDFITNGKIMGTKVYLIYENNGQYIIIVPNIAIFQIVGENVYCPELNIMFYLDK